MSGPVVVITRTKPLASQVLSEMVMMNKHLPDRIACWSDVEHDMDLKEPLAVGTISDSKVKNTIRDVFLNNKNVIIGAVTNGGSVELLKFLLEEKFPVKIIMDELAEAINGQEGEKLTNEQDKHNTLDVIYQLHNEGLLLKLFGFDAVWKTSKHRGMNDKTLWERSTATVKHTQDEMTFEKNVLVPVHLLPIAIDEEMANLHPSDSEQERKRKIEIAANIAVLNEEIELLSLGKQSQAKLLGFSSGSANARKNKLILDEKFGDSIDLNEVILASTSQDNRAEIQRRIISDETKIGFVTNYDIWTKGIDIPDLTAVSLGYGRLPGAEKLTHIIGRVSRRAKEERGKPIESLTIKPEGRLYVPFLVNDPDGEGGKKYQSVLKIWKKLYESGIVVDVTLITSGGGDGTKNQKKKLFTVEKGFTTVEDEMQEAIEIKEAIKAEMMRREKENKYLQQIEELKASMSDIWG